MRAPISMWKRRSTGTRPSGRALGLEFLDELRAAYDRIADGLLKYQLLRSTIRRAFLKRFPYAVYFSIEGHVIVVAAVLHASRDPSEWQRGRG